LTPQDSANPQPRPSLAQATWPFFWFGNTTFGGGFITMIILGRELVDRLKWITRKQFELAFALARVTPGTNIIAFCAATGMMLRGWAGAFSAVIAVTLPSAALAVLLMQGFETWQGNARVTSALTATVAAVTGAMWSTVWMLTRPHIGKWQQTLRGVVFMGGAFLAARLGVTPVPIILGALIFGYLWPPLRNEPSATQGDDEAKLPNEPKPSPGASPEAAQ
jgi:chromate transporter